MSFLDENSLRREPQSNITLPSTSIVSNETYTENTRLTDNNANRVVINQEDTDLPSQSSANRRPQLFDVDPVANDLLSPEQVDEMYRVVGPPPPLRTPVSTKRQRTQEQLVGSLRGFIKQTNNTCKLAKDIAGLIGDDDQMRKLSQLDSNRMFIWSFKVLWDSLSANKLFEVKTKVYYRWVI